MKTSLTLSVVMTSAALLVGCAKQEPAPTATKPAPAPAAPVPAASEVAAPAPPPPLGSVGTVATVQAVESTEEKLPAEKIVLYAVQSFVISKERPPKDLNELVQSGFLKTIPPVPTGKKIVFDSAKGTVTIENQ